MASKFAKQYHVPPEFPDILKDFTREVLRNQPANIDEFAAKYFDCLASGLPADMEGVRAPEEDEGDVSLDEIEGIIHDLFRKFDTDGNQYLDPQEFKTLMEDLQQRLDFPRDEIYRFLAEADMNADGVIEYEEFIPVALQIIQSIYAKKRLEHHISNVERQAEEILVHGMGRDELTEVISSLFERADQDHSGILSRQEFVAALTSMDLGLTRREINAIMFQVDQDEDGNISYREFVPFAYDLLQKLISLRLLESELADDELAQYLLDLFRARDTDMTGLLAVDDIRDLMHQAMLGLTRMQIYTVISTADINADDMISYSNFVPRAVSLVRDMLSFEHSLARDIQEANMQAEENFFAALDEAFAGMEALPLADFMLRLDQCGVMSHQEVQATRHLLSGYGDEVPVEDAKTQAWSLVKSMRRHRQ